MNERYHPPSPENNFHGRLSEGMLFMMNFEAATLGYTPPNTEAEFNPEDSLIFAQKIKKYEGLFSALFTNRGFHPAAAFPNIVPLVRLCLLSAPSIVMQDMKEHGGDTAFKKEFSEYNSTVREAILANPNLTKEGLLLLMQGGALWAKVPREHHYPSTIMFEKRIMGAASEIAGKKLFDSSAVQEAGITYRESTTEDDLHGTDLIVFLPDGREIRLDIKHNPRQVHDSGNTDHKHPLYRFHEDNKVKIYLGIRDLLEDGRLQLTQEDAEQRGAALIGTLYAVAEEIDTRAARKLPAHLAQRALLYRTYKQPWGDSMRNP